MTKEQLHNLVARGEGSTTEFKRAMPSDLGREICAFANAAGGVILIGVSDAGESVGVPDHNRLKSRVQSTARSADPPIWVEVESVGEVLCVLVPPQERKPYSFGGRFFIRDGASSQQMSNEEVENLFYAVGRLHFDKKPCEVFSMESDLDDETWARFSERAKIPAAMDRVVALRNLGLVDAQDHMTHAGAWLLARDIRRFTTSAHVSCALFMGTEKVRILDRRDFHSDIPTMIDEVVAWILTKINVEYIIKHVRRQEMEEADLGTKSVPRNPLLFSMLYRMDVVENIGSGIRRIRELCQEHGVPEPVIDVSEHWVTTTFLRPVAEVEGQVVTKSQPESLDRNRTSTPQVPHKYHASQKTPASIGWRAISCGNPRPFGAQGSGEPDDRILASRTCLRFCGNDHPRQAPKQQTEVPLDSQRQRFTSGTERRRRLPRRRGRRSKKSINLIYPAY